MIRNGTNQRLIEETVAYEAFPKLLPMGDFDLNNLRKLLVLSCRTINVDTLMKLRGPKTTTSEQKNH